MVYTTTSSIRQVLYRQQFVSLNLYSAAFCLTVERTSSRNYKETRKVVAWFVFGMVRGSSMFCFHTIMVVCGMLYVMQSSVDGLQFMVSRSHETSEIRHREMPARQRKRAALCAVHPFSTYVTKLLILTAGVPTDIQYRMVVNLTCSTVPQCCGENENGAPTGRRGRFDHPARALRLPKIKTSLIVRYRSCHIRSIVNNC